MAWALAGCATVDPPPVDAEPPCDLICQFLRLFTPEPPPAPSLPPEAPPVKIKHARGHSRRAPNRPTVAEEVVAPLPDDEPLGPPVLRPTANPMLVPIPGSPGITPPWFEPPLPD